ncbi:MAG: type II toxin-antitoxin system VapC family toxin [Candidatus Binatia bacterium]
MSMHVLDTDHFSLHLRGHHQVRERLALLPPQDVAITIITAEEHLRGRLAQVNKANAGDARATAYTYLHKAITDLAKLHILDYDTAADTIYQELRRQRLRIGSQDLRIAAITLANQGCLITRNRSDFGRIPNLVSEDWTI